MSRIDYLAQLYGERLVNTIAFSSYVPPNLDITDSVSILNYLQTIAGNKIQWVVLRVLDCNIRLEDMQRVQQALQSFDRFKNRLPSKDINSFRTIAELEDALSHFEQQPEVLSNKQQAKLIKLEGAEYVIDSTDFKVLLIKTSDAAKFYGCGTKWCTAARNNNIFDHYNNKGPLYIILAGDRKFQFHYSSEQFMNERDEPVTKFDKVFLSQFDQWRQFLDIMIEKYLGGYFDDHISKIFQLSKPTINLFDLHTTPEVLQRYSIRYMIPEYMLPMIKKPGFKKNPEMERYVVNNSECAYAYARHVLKGRFVEGESIIARSAAQSYAYARYVLEGRFIEGERAILTDINCTYMYARNVLGGRFIEGEQLIATSASQSYLYAKEVIQGRFVLGEKVLASSSEYGYNYAKKVIGGRFMQWETHHNMFAMARHQDKYVQLYNKLFGTVL